MSIKISIAGLALTLLAATSAQALATSTQDDMDRPLEIGERGTLGVGEYGCLLSSELDRFWRILNSDDKEGIRTWIRFNRDSGTCTRLNPWTEFFVEENAPRGIGALCVRPVGQVHCLWVRGVFAYRGLPRVAYSSFENEK